MLTAATGKSSSSSSSGKSPSGRMLTAATGKSSNSIPESSRDMQTRYRPAVRI
jgi:hypothetical protein